MRCIYKVTKTTPKSVELTEVSICGDVDSCRPDPTYRPCEIKFENNKPVFGTILGKNGKTEDHKVKKIIKFDETGFIKMFKIGWESQGLTTVIAKNDEEAKLYKFEQYWG